MELELRSAAAKSVQINRKGRKECPSGRTLSLKLNSCEKELSLKFHRLARCITNTNLHRKKVLTRRNLK